MFNFKKISMICLSLIIIATSSLTVFASEFKLEIFDNVSKMLNEDINTWEELSIRTGIPVKDLKEAYSTIDSKTFLNSIQETANLMDIYENDTINNNASTYSVSFPGPVMPTSVWREFKSQLRNGSILISQHSYTLGFQHGHAAIISGVYNSNSNDPLNRTIYFTEHPGGGNLSWRKELHNSPNLWWRRQLGVASYNVNDLAIMERAGEEARMPYMLNKPYSVFGYKDVISNFNCSSLVWTAYRRSSGIDIGSSSPNVLPYHIAKSRYTYPTFKYGNYTW